MMPSVTEISSSKPQFWGIPVLLSDLHVFCFLSNWVFQCGSKFRVGIGRIPWVGEEPIQVLILAHPKEAGSGKSWSKQRWNIGLFLSDYMFWLTKDICAGAVTTECCRCCTGTRSWAVGWMWAGFWLTAWICNISHTSFLKLFFFLNNIIHDFAIICSFVTLLHFLGFVLASGLQREGDVQCFITQGKKHRRSDVLASAFQECLWLVFKSCHRC